MEAVETIFVPKSKIMAGSKDIRKAFGDITANAPIAVATPFPPLKDKKGEKI